MSNPIKRAVRKSAKPREEAPRSSYRAGSFTDSLSKLDVGQSLAQVQRIPLVEATQEAKINWYDSVRGPVHSYVQRVRKHHPDMDYIIQRGEFQTADNHVMLVTTVTRTS